MLESENNDILIYRAKEMISLAGEKMAKGKDLSKSLDKVENAAIITKNGIICAVDKWNLLTKPVNSKVIDLGDVCIAPALVNAHCHLQLSGLKDKTIWHKGFISWLKSLVPQLASLPENDFNAKAINSAVLEMKKSGIACVGDFTSNGCSIVKNVLEKQAMSSLAFLEYFGYANTEMLNNDYDLSLPKEKIEYAQDKTAFVYESTYAGHALYSTDIHLLLKLKKYCADTQSIFSMHLAESLEEENALLNGSGALVDFYAQRILPKDWTAPKMRPVAAAKHYGLLGQNSLMVHGVHLNCAEAEYLAQTNTSLCLCPRSNNNLGVGQADVAMLLNAGILLCLGTDGLSSVSNLDLWEDIKTLYLEQNISFKALLRMATINGACCLGFSEKLGSLEKGKYFSFSIIPSSYN